MNEQPAAVRSRVSYLNVVLTVIAGLLALQWLDREPSRDSLTGVAHAQRLAPPEEEASTGRVTATEQRRTMIGELQSMSKRLGQLETALAKGINVKVLEMPELKLPSDSKSR